MIILKQNKQVCINEKEDKIQEDGQQIIELILIQQRLYKQQVNEYINKILCLVVTLQFAFSKLLKSRPQIFLPFLNLIKHKFPSQSKIPYSSLLYNHYNSYYNYVMQSTQKNLKIDYNPSIHSSYMYFLFPAIIIIGYILGYIMHIPFSVIFIIYGLIPLLDKVLTQDWVNPQSLQQLQKLQNRGIFRFALYFSITLDWLAFLNGIIGHQKNPNLFYKFVGSFLVINLASTGFLIAHQLFHKQSYLDKIVGTLHMIKNLYMHFTIQHLFGHHKKVATPDDPASADKGITVYQFVPKSIIGGYISAFKISPKFVILTSLISFLIVAWSYYYLGPQMAFFIVFWALGSIVYLETINYIQHYGLRRKRNLDGSYQKVTIRHSWNAPHRMSNYLFFKLQRHSDHHENSLKPYQTLCSLQDSPQLPHGYLVCIVMAYFPKTWFSIMDPLVDEYQKTQKGTNLKALMIAEEKANDFVVKMFSVTFGMMMVEIIYRKILIPMNMI